MPSEIDWENEADFKEDDEDEVDEDTEEYEEDEEFDEDEEESEEYEEYDEDEEESEEDEELDEDEEEFEEDEYEEEPTNRTVLFIDGSNISYKLSDKIAAAAKVQGDLIYAEIFRSVSDKHWNNKISKFDFPVERTFFKTENKTDTIKNAILSKSSGSDIVCISTIASFYKDIINELKADGKKVVLIAIPNTAAVLMNACDQFIQVQPENNKKAAANTVTQAQPQPKEKVSKKTESPTQPNDKKTEVTPQQKNKTENAPQPQTRSAPNGIVYIDGNSISPKYIGQITDFANTRGNVEFACVFTVKGNGKAKKWGKRAAEFDIRNICLDKNTKKSDFAAKLCKDLKEQLNTTEYDFLCIATEDEVFKKKIQEIRKSGKKVFILGSNKLPAELSKAGDDVYDLTNGRMYSNYEYVFNKCAVNTVLFIDGENITHEYANLILAKAWEQGNLNLSIGGVYFREDDPATKPWKLRAKAFRINTNQVKGKAAKNKVDNAIISDALKCMEENDGITTFCIASHDKDYAKTIMKLRKAGKRVCVIGTIDKASDEMRFICDEFIPI